MQEYKVLLSIPSQSNQWQAHVETRYIEAENLNYCIMTALPPKLVKNGARIIEIWEIPHERGIIARRIK